MKALITGGSSLLGKALLQTKPDHIQADATWYTNYVSRPMYQLDITNKSQVSYIFDRTRPEIVIHCAASGSVDFAETHYSEAYEVNVLGTENIARACHRFGAKLIFISSNAVFDGNNPPYSEQSETNPVNRYGSLKLQAEERVKSCLNHWLILRCFMLYGWPWPGGRPNWATLVIDKLNRRERLKVVDDTYWQPTYVIDMANFIWRYLDLDREIYHLACRQSMTLYEFTLAVAEEFDFNLGFIEPVGSDYFSNLAPRPANSTFDLTKLEELGDGWLNLFRNPERGLRSMNRDNPLRALSRRIFQ